MTVTVDHAVGGGIVAIHTGVIFFNCVSTVINFVICRRMCYAKKSQINERYVGRGGQRFNFDISACDFAVKISTIRVIGVSDVIGRRRVEYIPIFAVCLCPFRIARFSISDSCKDFLVRIET